MIELVFFLPYTEMSLKWTKN